MNARVAEGSWRLCSALVRALDGLGAFREFGAFHEPDAAGEHNPPDDRDAFDAFDALEASARACALRAAAAARGGSGARA